MRTYAVVNNVWTEISTDAMGNDDAVWIATLMQCLRGVLGEDPFFADVGLPDQESLVSQVAPDFYVAKLQARFAQYFTSLQIKRRKTPTSQCVYDVNIITHSGAIIPQFSV